MLSCHPRVLPGTLDSNSLWIKWQAEYMVLAFRHSKSIWEPNLRVRGAARAWVRPATTTEEGDHAPERVGFGGNEGSWRKSSGGASAAFSSAVDWGVLLVISLGGASRLRA